MPYRYSLGNTRFYFLPIVRNNNMRVEYMVPGLFLFAVNKPGTLFARFSQ